MNDAIRARLFLVGCPRSGTTLLQSMLAAHSAIASFPESHFLLITSRSRRGRWLRKVGLVAPEMWQQLRQFLLQIGHSELIPPVTYRLQRFVQQFAQILDQVTVAQGKVIWVEKTPGHLYYIDDFTAAIPDARFIHLIRNGADVVASLYEVTNQYPEIWGGRHTIAQCIERWNGAVQRSRHYCAGAGHHCVRYEQLISQPEETLAALCDFIGVAYEPAMIAKRHKSAAQVIAAHEPWKAATLNALNPTGETKFKRLFTASQQHAILQQLVTIED